MANQFEVRELGGRTSNVRFDYRITALRKNYENVRFADHTKEFEAHKRMPERMRTPAAARAASSHMPTNEQYPVG